MSFRNILCPRALAAFGSGISIVEVFLLAVTLVAFVQLGPLMGGRVRKVVIETDGFSKVVFGEIPAGASGEGFQADDVNFVSGTMFLQVFIQEINRLRHVSAEMLDLYILTL